MSMSDSDSSSSYGAEYKNFMQISRERKSLSLVFVYSFRVNSIRDPFRLTLSTNSAIISSTQNFSVSCNLFCFVTGSSFLPFGVTVAIQPYYYFHCS